MRLHLGGHLDWYDPQKRAWLDLRLDTPLLLTDLLQQLGIPSGEVAIVAVDRRAVPLEGTTVSDGNRVELYPPMGGGATGGVALPPALAGLRPSQNGKVLATHAPTCGGRGVHDCRRGVIKRRVRQAGLPHTTCCHPFRATGITTYLQKRWYN